MGTRVKFAAWRKIGQIFVVRPPDWPKNVELSFVNQGDMMRWASAERIMLRDANKRDYKGK